MTDYEKEFEVVISFILREFSNKFEKRHKYKVVEGILVHGKDHILKLIDEMLRELE